MKIDCRCHCGFITYEAEVDPGEVYLCHCTDCQSISGGAFRWGHGSGRAARTGEAISARTKAALAAARARGTKLGGLRYAVWTGVEPDKAICDLRGEQNSPFG
jgi:hypothetical protein